MIVVMLALVGGAVDVFPSSVIPHPGRVALSIMIIAATLWITELVPLFVTSLIILVLSESWLQRALEAHGTPVDPATFTAPFFSDVILLFLGGFIISSALHKYALDRRMARAVLRRTGRSVPMLVLGIMMITAGLSMWLSNTATAAMMMSLCLPIVQRLPSGDRSRVAILLAVPFAANIGGMGTPIGSPPNAIALQYLKDIGGGPTFLTWMLIAIPLMVIMLIVAWILLIALARGGTTTVPPDGDDGHRPTPLTPKAWTIVAITLLTVAGWLSGGEHGLSVGTVALLPVITFFSVGILTIDDFRGLAWDILLLMGGGLCLGRVIAVSGLADWALTMLPADDHALIMLASVCCIMACAMSLVMSNTATANLVMPILMGMGTDVVPPLLIAVAMSCTLAMGLPVSTPPNAIAFSSGELAVRDLVKPGMALTGIGIALLLTLGLAVMHIVGV